MTVCFESMSAIVIACLASMYTTVAVVPVPVRRELVGPPLGIAQHEKRAAIAVRAPPGLRRPTHTRREFGVLANVPRPRGGGPGPGGSRLRLRGESAKHSS